MKELATSCEASKMAETEKLVNNDGFQRSSSSRRGSTKRKGSFKATVSLPRNVRRSSELPTAVRLRLNIGSRKVKGRDLMTRKKADTDIHPDDDDSSFFAKVSASFLDFSSSFGLGRTK